MKQTSRTEVLDIVYLEVRPKTFQEFWQSFKYYKAEYPLLLTVSLREAKHFLLRKQSS